MADQNEALRQIAASLNVMLGSAVALVDGMGNVVGYQIKTGALHRILGHMASVDCPVSVPLCRTQLVLNHESSPWPLEGTPAASGVAPYVEPSSSEIAKAAALATCCGQLPEVTQIGIGLDELTEIECQCCNRQIRLPLGTPNAAEVWAAVANGVQPCPDCGGRGHGVFEGDQDEQCDTCDGTGKVADGMEGLKR